MHYLNIWFGLSIGGLMDPQYIGAPWSAAKVVSVVNHLWIPMLVIGSAGTAAMIRRLRANMLDEMQKQYLVTARAKGLSPLKAILKYPLRMSLNHVIRSEEHTSELQSLMRISYAVFCLKKKKNKTKK